MNRARKFLARLALVVFSFGILFFVAEGFVRVIGWGAPIPAFRQVEVEGVEFREVPQNRNEGPAVRFPLHSTRFAKSKGEDVFRVFVFGGSTVFGMPFTLAAGGDDLSFASYLRERLAGCYTEKRIEVINTGAVGLALSDVTTIMEEVFEYDPDLLIVLSGHNEYLPHALLDSRARSANPITPALGSKNSGFYIQRGFHQFMTSMQERRDPGLGTLDWPTVESMVCEPHHREEDTREILDHAARCYAWMAKEAQDRGVSLFVSTCPSNLLDFEPSSTSLKVEGKQKEQWITLVNEARALQKTGEFEQAKEALNRALAIDDSGAEAHYRLGVLLARSDPEVAKSHLQTASNLDGVMRRAPTEINEIIRRTAQSTHAILCDVVQHFESLSENRLPGRTLFVDHVHPNLEASIAIANCLFECIQNDAARLGLSEKRSIESGDSRETILETLGYNPKLELQVDKQIGLSYANLILLRRYDPEARYEVAVASLQKVRDAIPESLYGSFPLYPLACTYLGGIHVIAGRRDRALDCFEEAARYDPNWSAPLREFTKVSKVLRDIFEEAQISFEN